MKKIVLKSIILIFLLSACSEGFLEERPNSNILSPTTEEDFQRLLDNFEIMGVASVLPQLAADEYYIISEAEWLSSRSAVERNSYTWEKDVYGGVAAIDDWNAPYRSVFYANNILAEIDKGRMDNILSKEMADIYGQALFHRANSYFDLLRNYAVPFDSETQDTDLGVPLRTDPSIDYTASRSSVDACYQLIFSDLDGALEHLQHIGPLPQRNRANILAAYALRSRIHMYRREYDLAEKYADSVLSRYDKLIDYNTVSLNTNEPFSRTNDELIMYGRTVMYNNAAQYNTNGTVFVDTTLLSLYDQNDLRLSIFFFEYETGKFIMKRGYNGSGNSPFVGFAVDEVLLNKAECLVRKGDLEGSASLMNDLLRKRYQTGKYKDVKFSEQNIALNFVLRERRKELVWRGLRWDDIKRLNKEGAGITIKRVLGDKEYTLAPNSAGYVFNIPQDEINRSGIIQNER